MRLSVSQLAKLSRMTAKVNDNIRNASSIPLTGAMSARRKYKNIPEVVDGFTFDSRLEAKRYGELKLLEKAGEICRLKMQTRWDLQVNNVHIAYYFSDFDYLEAGKLVVEDCKGLETPVFRIKAKMLFAQYGIEIVRINE